MPDWAPGRLGTYHLYFADHTGTFIRLAYADRVKGPWRMYEPGVLDLSRSLFVPQDLPPPPQEEWPEWAHDTGIEEYLYAHIASPSVIVDDENKRILMYYHGLLENTDQATRLAVSSNGMDFDPRPPLLGPPYFHMFRHQGSIYAVAVRGRLLRADTWEGPFEPGPRLTPFDTSDGFGPGFRHGGAIVVGNRLHLFYSRIGDRPERILHTIVSLVGPWTEWRAFHSQTILEPEHVWEGADLNLDESLPGAAKGRKRELRDPFVFSDMDGKNYLFYCGGGESAIGVVGLEGLD